MRYKKALQTAAKVGSSQACDDGLLAQVCRSLSSIHAINPELVYDGAKREGLTARELIKMSPVDIGNLQFT